jgi:transcriptional regulator with XRE-family HTH domain
MKEAELRRARKRLGMTQADLADALGMQRNSVARMENGRQAIMRTTELAVKYLLLTIPE